MEDMPESQHTTFLERKNREGISGATSETERVQSFYRGGGIPEQRNPCRLKSRNIYRSDLRPLLGNSK